ncbi:DUF6881 domain-containing protein [Myceligenerans crystallogenes]
MEASDEAPGPEPVPWYAYGVGRYEGGPFWEFYVEVGAGGRESRIVGIFAGEPGRMVMEWADGKEYQGRLRLSDQEVADRDALRALRPGSFDPIDREEFEEVWTEAREVGWRPFLEPSE